MPVLRAIGIILLIYAGIIGLCLVVLWLEKRFPDTNYDERQKLSRYKGANVSLMVGLIYFLVVTVILIGQVDGEKTVEPFLLVLFGIVLLVTVDHVYCFLTHSAMPLSQRPEASIAGYLFCGVLHLMSFGFSHGQQPLRLVGHGSSGWIQLVVGIDFCLLALMHLLQLLHREKE